AVDDGNTARKIQTKTPFTVKNFQTFLQRKQQDRVIAIVKIDSQNAFVIEQVRFNGKFLEGSWRQAHHLAPTTRPLGWSDFPKTAVGHRRFGLIRISSFRGVKFDSQEERFVP